MLYFFGVMAGKLAGTASQIIGMNGTSLPGKVGRLFDGAMLQKLARQVDDIVIVTGTNGKTTTANLLSHMVSYGQRRYLNNGAGSNLITGITSSFIHESDLRGRIKDKDIAILEVDEATMERVLAYVTPSVIVVTNFFRDQLDRYGQIENIVDKVKTSIAPHKTKLILNADDPFAMRLSTLDCDISYFGLQKNSYTFPSQTMTDSKFCLCGHPFSYDYVHYGQLGYYHCENCGFKRPTPQWEATRVTDTPTASVTVNGKTYHSSLKGAYNAYNILAAIAVGETISLSRTSMKKGLKSYTAENGRMQQFFLYNSPLTLNLAKNPQGVNSTLSDFLQSKEDKQMVFFLNDLDADGKDPSWIWDADYEHVNRSDVKRVICSGIRAYDMAIRILYAGVPKERILVLPSYQEAIDEMARVSLETYILSNYTPLEEVRKLLLNHEDINTDNREWV
ncbi:DUF1727 domain-containing protein (plasmid) [Pontibacillus sp. ALD_SL1]|uniref:MurT ligase domain-containing protein n=1 Tax=Pontibacillus sp. ALD_SL1 TaxID=2777185 RepID=UPI001A95B425|nr:MurT ligase domain-containing protein [Pontibacillus sp. ALD_SL1]QST02666.1 DUF1727 domain-containing protein [Pontibacillus sp. ALD_SL1]